MIRMSFLCGFGLLILATGCGDSAKPGRGVPVSGQITLAENRWQMPTYHS
jgi:hypothetical protein